MARAIRLRLKWDQSAMVAYEVIPLNNAAERSRYLVCADDTEALRVAGLLRLEDRAQVWQGPRNIGEVAPLIPSGPRAAA